MSNNDALVQRIVEIIRTHVNPKQGLANLKQNQNIVPGIMAIIKKAVDQNAVKVINYAPTNDVAKAVTKIIQNKVKLSSPVTVAVIPPLVTGGQTSAAVQVIKQANASDVATAITKLIQNSVRIPRPVAGAAVQTLQTEPTPEHLSLIERLKRIKWPWSGFFSGKGKMAAAAPQPNFVEPNKNNRGRFNPPPPGYILTTRNGKTGWFRNKGPGVPLGPAGPPAPRNYTKMTIRELLDALRKYPENRPIISEALRKALEKELKDIKYEYSKSRRARKLGDLLRLLPRNYNGRRNASSIVVDDIRNTRNGRELLNVRSNLGKVPNENIRRAFEEQNRRFRRNKDRETTETGRGTRRVTPVRRFGESNNNYNRRVKNTEGERELLELMRRRRAAYLGGGGNGGGAYAPPPPPPIPLNQRQAINNAGGVNRAVNTVVQVPGGAPEVAKAAEALNEAKGNTTYAITVKGASPAAVNAVQKLGGPNNAVNVLEGLNTMAQTHATRRRKVVTRRSKKVLRPRVAELNRVINAVKKQRLISLVAHNVTKTHNIHPNDEKLKKYYKKVLKANILRTPFVKIAKRAAKKRG